MQEIMTRSKTIIILLFLFSLCSGQRHGIGLGNALPRQIPNTRFTISACPPALDLIFLFDTSGSTRQQFSANIVWSTSILKQLPVGKDLVRVAAIQFGGKPQTEFNLNTYTSGLDVVSHLENMQFRSGTTRVVQALKQARMDLLSPARGGRPGAKKVVVVFSDGQTIDNPSTVAQNMREIERIGIYAVGFAQDTFIDDLVSLTGDIKRVFRYSTLTCYGTLPLKTCSSGDLDDFQDSIVKEMQASRRCYGVGRSQISYPPEVVYEEREESKKTPLIVLKTVQKVAPKLDIVTRLINLTSAVITSQSLTTTTPRSTTTTTLTEPPSTTAATTTPLVFTTPVTDSSTTTTATQLPITSHTQTMKPLATKNATAETSFTTKSGDETTETTETTNSTTVTETISVTATSAVTTTTENTVSSKESVTSTEASTKTVTSSGKNTTELYNNSTAETFILSTELLENNSTDQITTTLIAMLNATEATFIPSNETSSDGEIIDYKDYFEATSSDADVNFTEIPEIPLAPTPTADLSNLNELLFLNNARQKFPDLKNVPRPRVRCRRSSELGLEIQTCVDSESLHQRVEEEALLLPQLIIPSGSVSTNHIDANNHEQAIQTNQFDLPQLSLLLEKPSVSVHAYQETQYLPGYFGLTGGSEGKKQFNRFIPDPKISASCPMDILFLLDSSGSVKNSYDEQVQMLKNAVELLTISPTHHRVAIMQFAGKYLQHLEFAFNTYSNNIGVRNAIDKFVHYTGTTYIGSALSAARQIMNTRRTNVPTMLVILSDGYSQDSAVAQARILQRQLNVHIFAVGLPQQSDRVYLKLLTGSNSRVFTGPSALVQFTQNILSPQWC